MLYGISFLYGQFGTLYFEDIAVKMQATPLTVIGLVFFFSGLGFKISLVPFHFWTADTYQVHQQLYWLFERNLKGCCSLHIVEYSFPCLR